MGVAMRKQGRLVPTFVSSIFGLGGSGQSCMHGLRGVCRHGRLPKYWVVRGVSGGGKGYGGSSEMLLGFGENGLGRGMILDKVVVVGEDMVKVRLRVEDVGGRQRRISGGLDVEGDVGDVWRVLTDYVGMQRYMPNILESRVVDLEEGGDVGLEQVGIISRRLGLKSRMVMRVREREGRWIRFSRVEGRDFTEFEGEYMVRSVGDGVCRLEYEVFAVPMPLFPVALVERKIVKEVPVMLAAVREEVLKVKERSGRENSIGMVVHGNGTIPHRAEDEKPTSI
eukprot:Plantae.Rhodophyta-Hildenbrandia_rubra.ctg7178.p1 GENE.Plantae.Rhodophyta-Hildenbrandia_rubra.ctg7178~~Plantae.Rhodophyta-Hildenbrandia_rubra.ctg7178.p1  ORF type:complete len:281 (-),score=70.99 Plantae.Rhodophyta-Hildenbrandia_rubra.ctg7178:1033-1875(-)